MRRSRATDVSLGLVAVLLNVAIVVAVVLFVGRSDSSHDGIAGPSPHGAPSSIRSDVGDPPLGGTPSGEPGATTDASQLLAGDDELVISVLGDGTGDEDGEWVTVFADLLGAARTVALRNLDPTDPTRYAEERTYGESGPLAIIWNGSRLGATASYAAERLDFLVPEEPDLVVLNYGREDTASSIEARLDLTLSAIQAKWPKVPVAVVLQAQNTDDQIAPVRAATAEWAEGHGLPRIDVAGAFIEAGDPNSFVSIVDPPSVNARGGRLWGETVFTALGGQFDTQAPKASDATATIG